MTTRPVVQPRNANTRSPRLSWTLPLTPLVPGKTPAPVRRTSKNPSFRWADSPVDVDSLRTPRSHGVLPSPVPGDPLRLDVGRRISGSQPRTFRRPTPERPQRNRHARATLGRGSRSKDRGRGLFGARVGSGSSPTGGRGPGNKGPAVVEGGRSRPVPRWSSPPK